MGKKGKRQYSAPSKQEVYAHPSKYGSHLSMVNAEATADLYSEKWVICEDENGKYATEIKRLDNGLADPHRYASKEWRKKNMKKLRATIELSKELKDDEEKSNQH